MLKFYLLVVTRKLFREKFYAFICMASLSLGVACSVLISLYLYSELTYDHYHVKHENIYKLGGRLYDREMPVTGYSTGPLLHQDNAEVLDFVRFVTLQNNVFDAGGNTVAWENAYFVDASVFDVFTFTPVYGDTFSAFSDPYSAAVSESFARQHFGDDVPLGRTITTENYDLRISLVYEDLPENTHLRYDVLVPMSLYENSDIERGNFGALHLTGSTTFLLMADDFDAQRFDEMSTRHVENHMTSPVAIEAYQLTARSLDAVHFEEEVLDKSVQSGAGHVLTLLAIDIFLLLIACVNYINIATARAGKRSKEIGMRKVMGAGRSQLILHFLAESCAFSFCSVLLGALVGICILELGIIDQATGKRELLSFVYTPQFFLFMASIWATVTLVSGLYPALYLSRAPLMSSLRKSVAPPSGILGARHVLVLFQLVVTSSIIACVLVMEDQVQFLADTPLGFEKENRLVVRLRGAELIEDMPLISAELMTHGDIVSVAAAWPAPGRGLMVSIQDVENNEGMEVSMPTNISSVGSNYLTSFGIDVVEGREFSGEPVENDLNTVLVNEAFVRAMQWDQPLGKRVGSDHVVGVFKDYHYMSLHEPIAPLALYRMTLDFDEYSQTQRENVTRDLIVEVAPGGLDASRPVIREVVGRFGAPSAIELLTLEESWTSLYEQDINLTRLIGIFAGISIAISLLGIIGLATFSAEQRRREIAIRKVLGASTGMVVRMMLVNTSILLLAAAVPATVISYYVASQWMNRFSYRVELGLGPFVYALLVVGSITSLAVFLQSYATARSNPVESLRYE